MHECIPSDSNHVMLPSIPSFSFLTIPEDLLPRHGDDGDGLDATGSGDLSFPKNPIPALVSEEERPGGDVVPARDDNEELSPPPPMYMARGLGIDRCHAGSGSDLQRNLAEFPCDPTLLKNHARLLASRGEVHGAEDYYHQATLADPEDGETLMQYAKLVWELHHDQQRASTYFKFAAEASPDDCDVLAALASFLWEIGDDEGMEPEDHNQGGEYGLEASYLEVPSSHNGGDHSSASFTADKSVGGEDEEYFLSMIKESPSDPLLLRNYAQFLYQSKQDLHGAMEYYSRAADANPVDGESFAMHAKLVWQLHGDHDKAAQLFERAINAVPGDCDVLAAHASYLWETDVNED